MSDSETIPSDEKLNAQPIGNITLELPVSSDQDTIRRKSLTNLESLQNQDFSEKSLRAKLGVNHIERQNRARKLKEDEQNRLKMKSRPNLMQSQDIPGGVTEKSQTRLLSSTNTKQVKADQSMYYEYDDLSDIKDIELGEPIVELLERERREWHDERMKLLNCIHLQQIELNQRSKAVTDIATNIAKQFADVIESFENRLLVVESKVQKDLKDIRVIAESLKSSVHEMQQLSAITVNNTIS